MQTSGTLRDNQGRTWLTFRNCQIDGSRLTAECAMVDMPSTAVALFKEYEEIVSTQQFSLLPDIERRIDAFGLFVIWSGESAPKRVNDVEVRDQWMSFALKDG